MEKNHKFLTLAISLCLIALCGCRATGPKEGTAGDQMVNAIKDGLMMNNRLMPSTKVPHNVQVALVPNMKLDIQKAQEKGEKRFNLSAQRVPAKAFFLGLVEDTNYNVALHPDVAGEISLTLKNVSIHEVLETVHNIYGYEFRENKHSIEVMPAQLQTRAFKVNYIDMDRSGKSDMRISSSGLDTADSGDSSDSSSDDSSSDSSDSSSDSDSGTINSRVQTITKANFWTELKTALEQMIGASEGRSVSVNPLSGIVLVKAMPQEMRRVATFLKDSELSMNKQVIIEAKILEVELNDGYQAGINWGLLSGRMRASQTGSSQLVEDGSNDNTIPEVVTQARTINSATDLMNMVPNRGATDIGEYGKTTIPFGGLFSLAMNYKNLATFVELLGSQGNVQVLSNPRISTTNNQKALIKVGTDDFYVTSFTNNTTTANGVTSNTPSVDFDSFFSGIALDVTPQISEDDHITLHVHPTISSVTTRSQTISAQTLSLASSQIRESDSIIRARNGQMVVIGGLMQDRTQEIVLGVPYLKDIPFIGQLFRHTRQQSVKTELVILLRPIVIDDDEWNFALGDYERRYQKANRGFHTGGARNLFGNLGEYPQ